LKPNGLSVALRNLQRQDIKAFVPTREITRRARDSLRTRQSPLFPGYVFVQFDPGLPGWHRINATRGITRLLVENRHTPRPLPPAFMHGLLARCDANGRLITPEDIRAGDPVRVTAGPFADFISRVEHVTEDERLQVLLEIMGQGVRVSLPKTSVVKRRLDETG